MCLPHPLPLRAVGVSRPLLAVVGAGLIVAGSAARLPVALA